MRTSLAKKGSRFAEDVEVCLGDLDPDHAPGDERVSASAPPATKHRRGGNIHSPVTLAKPPVPECCAGCLGLPALVRPSVLGRSLPPEGSSSTLAWGSALGFRVGAAPPLPASNPGGHAMLSSDAIGRGPAPMEAGCFAPPGGWRPCPGSSLVAQQQQQVRIHVGPSHYGLTVFLVTQLECLSSAFAAALSALAPCTALFASNTAVGGTGATPSG